MFQAQLHDQKPCLAIVALRKIRKGTLKVPLTEWGGGGGMGCAVLGQKSVEEGGDRHPGRGLSRA